MDYFIAMLIGAILGVSILLICCVLYGAGARNQCESVNNSTCYLHNSFYSTKETK